MAKKDVQRDSVESAIAYIVIRRLMKKVDETSAYQMGLIDKNYKILRDPQNEDEELALSPLNLLVFQLRRVLGPAINRLLRFLYVNNWDDDKFLDLLLTRSLVSNRSNVKKVVDDLKKLR